MDRGYFPDAFVISWQLFCSFSQMSGLFCGEKKKKKAILILQGLRHFWNSFCNHGYDIGSKAILIGITLVKHWDKEVRVSRMLDFYYCCDTSVPASGQCEGVWHWSVIYSGLNFWISSFWWHLSRFLSQKYCKIKKETNLELERESLALFETYTKAWGLANLAQMLLHNCVCQR